MLGLPPQLLFFAACTAVAGFIWGLVIIARVVELEKQGDPALLRIVIWVAGLAPIGVTILSPRILAYTTPIQYEHTALSSLRLWPLAELALTAGLMALCILGLLIRALAVPARRANDRRLWVGALVFWASTTLTISFSTEPAFFIGMILIPVVVTAVYQFRNVDPAWLVAEVSKVLLVYVYASLLALLIAPGWAAEHYLAGLFGGSIRLSGVTPAPLNIGAIAALFLLLRLPSPEKSTLAKVHVTAAGLVLLLSQAKTAIIALAAGLLLVWVLKNREKYQAGFRLAVVGALLVTVAVLTVGPARGVVDIEESRFGQNENVQTLSGRTEIWERTLETWRENPLWGYGPLIWSEDFRRTYGGAYSWVGSAHNQYLQTLGQSGLVGISGLIFYLLTLLVVALRTINVSNRLSVALPLYLAILMTTDTPLTTWVVSPPVFTHIAIVSLLCTWNFHAKNRAGDPVVSEAVLATNPRPKSRPPDLSRV